MTARSALECASPLALSGHCARKWRGGQITSGSTFVCAAAGRGDTAASVHASRRRCEKSWSDKENSPRSNRGFNGKTGQARRGGRKIPKGFRHLAQGCEARATLGHLPEMFSTPTGLRQIRQPPNRNRVAVGNFLRTLTQGSLADSATAGLWDGIPLGFGLAEVNYALNGNNALRQRLQSVGCSALRPMFISQYQQRSRFWPPTSKRRSRRHVFALVCPCYFQPNLN